MNILVVYSVENNDVISKTEISWENHQGWRDLSELKNYLSLKSKKIKYFDDERELISVTNNEDFVIFMELVREKSFAYNEVIVIVHDDVLNLKKFSCLDNLLKLKIEDRGTSSFIDIRPVSSIPNSTYFEPADGSDSSSSSSSSSIPIQRRKPYVGRNKGHQPNLRYAAILKKEVNYLSGSEVSDGQTIIKKWKIKNVGSKKWKENSVKCVLLPSEFSSWVTHSHLKFPTCFADQKVDVEMEINIHGLWDARDPGLDQDSQDINLTWLLFKDALLTNSIINFKDYILICLELRIKVKKRTYSTDFQSSTTAIELKKHLSESSIERVDQDFSIVNMSEEEENDKKEHRTNEVTVSYIESKLMRDDSDVLDIELPECPHGDNFQITDFNKPGDFISTSPKKVEMKDNVKSEEGSILGIFNESNYVGKVVSSIEVLPTQKDIEDTIAQSLIGMRVKHGNFERLSTNEEDTNLSILDEILLSIKIEDQDTAKNVDQDNVSIGHEEEHSTITMQEIVLSINHEDNDDVLKGSENNQENINAPKDDECAEEDEFIECDMVQVEQVLKVEEDNAHNESKTDRYITAEDEINMLKAELGLKSDFKEDENIITEKESDKNVLSEVEDVKIKSFDKDESVHNDFVIKEPTNNVICQNTDNVSRQKPIDTIKNEFPRSNQSHTTQYQFGRQNPCVNQPTNYVPGGGQGNALYQTPQTYQQPPYPCYPPALTYNMPSTPYSPGIIPTTTSNRGITSGNAYPVINYPQCMPVTHPQVLQESSDNIIENLRRGGHIHDHVNEGPIIQRADNGQHYVTSVNLERLKGMGFTDEVKNRRLLTKFNNNINDVINDLID